MYEDASQVATDAISSIRTVASFCSEKRITTIYDHKCEASMNQGVRTGIVGGIGFGFSFLMLYLTYGLCFYVGAQFVRHGQSDFGGVFKVCKMHYFTSNVSFSGFVFFIFNFFSLNPSILNQSLLQRSDFI
jgi:ABC-type bacteriocin/lantibiotic exporter with double-glycine peptidase domain